MSKTEKLKKFLICLTILFTACFLMNGRLFAQTTQATLKGVVIDE